MLVDVALLRANGLLELLAGSLAAGHELLQLHHDLGELLAGHEPEQRRLAADVVVEAALQDAELLRDVLDAGAVVALLREHLRGGVDDLLPAANLGHVPHPPLPRPDGDRASIAAEPNRPR